MKKGDAIATVAKPIARSIDYFFGTDLQNCDGCRRMQNNLNAGMNLADAFYDRFWPKPNGTNMETEEEEVQFVLQVVVSARGVKEALEKLSEGTVIAVNPRPKSIPQANMPFRPPPVR